MLPAADPRLVPPTRGPAGHQGHRHLPHERPGGGSGPAHCNPHLELPRPPGPGHGRHVRGRGTAGRVSLHGAGRHHPIPPGDARNPSGHPADQLQDAGQPPGPPGTQGPLGTQPARDAALSGGGRTPHLRRSPGYGPRLPRPQVEGSPDRAQGSPVLHRNLRNPGRPERHQTRHRLRQGTVRRGVRPGRGGDGGPTGCRRLPLLPGRQRSCGPPPRAGSGCRHLQPRRHAGSCPVDAPPVPSLVRQRGTGGHRRPLAGGTGQTVGLARVPGIPARSPGRRHAPGGRSCGAPPQVVPGSWLVDPTRGSEPAAGLHGPAGVRQTVR